MGERKSQRGSGRSTSVVRQLRVGSGGVDANLKVSRVATGRANGLCDGSRDLATAPFSCADDGARPTYAPRADRRRRAVGRVARCVREIVASPERSPAYAGHSAYDGNRTSLSTEPLLAAASRLWCRKKEHR